MDEKVTEMALSLLADIDGNTASIYLQNVYYRRRYVECSETLYFVNETKFSKMFARRVEPQDSTRPRNGWHL